MRFWPSALLVGLVMLAVGAGCDGERIPAAGEGPLETFPGRVFVPGTGGMGGAGGVGGSGSGPAGACVDPGDLDILIEGNVNQASTFCTGFACIATIGDATRYAGCVTACIEERLVGLSTECAACYGDLSACGLSAFCFDVCQFDTCSFACVNCRSFGGCLVQFEQCRGLPGDGCEPDGFP